MEGTELTLWLAAVTILGGLSKVLHNLQDRYPALGRMWLVLATITLVVGVFAVVLIGAAILEKEEPAPDPTNSTDFTTDPAFIGALGDSVGLSTPQTEERRFDFRERNSHCAGPLPVVWPVTPGEGWRIDVNSIDVTVESASRKSVYQGIHGVTEEGFTIRGRVENSGTCIKVLGEVVARDARGSLRVAGTYRVREAR